MEPLQITSKRPSMQKNFSAVASSGNAVISSKKSRVFPGRNFREGSSREMFLTMLEASYPSARMPLYFSSRTKLISMMLS